MDKSLRPALKMINSALEGKGMRKLSKEENLVVRAAWYDLNYEDVVVRTSVNPEHLRCNVGRILWGKLTEAFELEEKVTKKSLRTVIERIAKPEPLESEKEIARGGQDSAVEFRGKPPELTDFVGRVPELALLREALKEDQCIAVTGGAGIGKSALLSSLCKTLKTEAKAQFKLILWKSLAHKPSFSMFVLEILEMLGKSRVEIPSTVTNREKLLVKELNKDPYLLILDTVERIIEGNQAQKRIMEEEYKTFFRRMVEEVEASRIVLLSRLPVVELRRMQESGYATRTIKLEGLGKDSYQLLRLLGLQEKENWERIIELYRGNPLALKLVANRIKTYFAGSVSRFLESTGTWLADSMEESISTYFEYLSEIERQVLINLVKEIEEDDYIELQEVLSMIRERDVNSSNSRIIETIKNLSDISLIETIMDDRGELLLSVQPIIRKYIKWQTYIKSQELSKEAI